MSQWQPYTAIAVADPDFSAKDGARRVAVGSRQGPVHHRQAALRRRQGRPEREGPDDDRLGALQAARRRWQDRRDGARFVGHQPDAGRRKTVGPTDDIGYMPFPNQVDGKFQSRPSRRPAARDQQEHQVPRRREGVGQLLHRRVRVRRQRERHPDRRSTGAAPDWFDAFTGRPASTCSPRTRRRQAKKACATTSPTKPRSTSGATSTDRRSSTTLAARPMRAWTRCSRTSTPEVG